MPTPIEVILYPEADAKKNVQWTAESRLYDIMTVGESPDDAAASFMRIMTAELTLCGGDVSALPLRPGLSQREFNEDFTRPPLTFRIGTVRR